MKQIWSTSAIAGAAQAGYSRRSALKAGAAIAGVGAMAPFFPRPASAQVGGDLQVMAWEGFDASEQTSVWREANGVGIDVTAIGNQDDVHAKFLTGNPPPYDLAEYNQGYNRLYGDQLEIIRPIDPAMVPNYNADGIIDAFYMKPTWYWDDTLFGVPFCWGINSLVYRPDEMPEPTSFTDLLAPEYTGRIAIVDDTLATWPTAAKLAGYGDKYPNVTADEMAAIFDHFQQYRDQAKVISLTYGDVASLFVSGEIVALLTGWTGLPTETAKSGVETAYTIPKEGATTWCDAWFTPISTDNYDTALAYINQTLEPAVQASIAENNVCAVVSKGAIPLLNAEARALFDYDNIDAVLESAPLIGIPPIESDEVATYQDWVNAWNAFKVS